METSSYLADVLWRRWLCRDLKEDDLVLIVDENISRGQWCLRHVVLVHKAKDGHVRSAGIKEWPSDQADFQAVFLGELFIVRISIEIYRLYVTNVLVFCSQVIC